MCDIHDTFAAGSERDIRRDGAAAVRLGQVDAVDDDAQGDQVPAVPQLLQRLPPHRLHLPHVLRRNSGKKEAKDISKSFLHNAMRIN